MRSTGLPSRREALRLAALGALTIPGLSARGDAPSLRFRVVETAGLRRFGYPVSAEVPGLTDPAGLRLETGEGRPVPAQFRTVDRPGGPRRVILDFAASPGPREGGLYVIQGGKVETQEPRAGGMAVGPVEGPAHRVAHGPGLSWLLPDTLQPFLAAVGGGSRDYVKGGPGGFRARVRETGAIVTKALKADRVVIERAGPIAVGLRHEGTLAVANGSILTWTIRTTFPRSKSWVEVLWEVEDPIGQVSDMEAEVGLVLEGAPALVDFGAGSTVYGTLQAGESMSLEAGDKTAPHAWSIRKGTEGRLTDFAVAPPGGPPAEGWAHLMDRTRCTAAALADFGRDHVDRIAASADGRLVLSRQFGAGAAARPGGRACLKFWLHVVSMPVQIGAVTSPQAMQAPLVVEWLGG